MSKYNVELFESGQALDVDIQTYDEPPLICGTLNYEELHSKPKINGVTLEGNKSSEEIGIEEISNFELEELLK